MGEYCIRRKNCDSISDGGTQMSGKIELFSQLDKHHGLITGGFAFAAFVEFERAVPGGFRTSNAEMLVAGILFFIACTAYVWQRRNQSAVSYCSEQERISDKLKQLPWLSYFTCLCTLALAAFLTYLRAHLR
jgi:hypothetical protein